jgi:predicted small lipoprotein YifL
LPVYLRSPSLQPARRIAIVAVIAVAAAGCGRIGPLEPPPDAETAAKPSSSATEGSMEAISPQVKPKIPPITAPNQTFILDPLLK